jgi:hypothetical protein
MQRTKKVSVFLAAGLLIVLTAALPGELGLSGDWGKSRMAVLLLGFALALLPWLPRRRSHVQPSQNDLFLLPAFLLVIAVYLAFLYVSRDTTSNYYDLLAQSFRQGELSLPLRPDPALLALPNPYDPEARQGIKAPLDLSLYNGKFYLYWGPAPALLVAVAQPFLPGEVSDGYLLLMFLCGIFLVQSLLILHLWERFFPEIPRWMLVLSILVAGWIHPTLWLLTQPKIYETAIAGGQFFFIAGLLCLLTALDRPEPSAGRLVLAGIAWSLAVGTRSVMVFPIVFMIVMIVIWFYQRCQRSWSGFITGLIPLGTPLLVGAVAFAWYNWARFGSFSETGFSYALAGPNLREHLHELFSPVYAFQNGYNYLFHPFAVHGSFPFLSAIRGRLTAILPGQVLPEIYSAQAITGILFAAPFSIFAAAPIFRVGKRLFRREGSGSSHEQPEGVSLPWTLTGLAGASLLTFACLLAFFWTAMRYAEDFMPGVTLLGIIGFWQGYQAIAPNSNKGTMYIGLGVILAGLSILIGMLLALSVYSARALP